MITYLFSLVALADSHFCDTVKEQVRLVRLEPRPSSPPCLLPDGHRSGGDEGLGSRLNNKYVLSATNFHRFQVLSATTDGFFNLKHRDFLTQADPPALFCNKKILKVHMCALCLLQFSKEHSPFEISWVVAFQKKNFFDAGKSCVTSLLFSRNLRTRVCNHQWQLAYVGWMHAIRLDKFVQKMAPGPWLSVFFNPLKAWPTHTDLYNIFLVKKKKIGKYSWPLKDFS